MWADGCEMVFYGVCGKKMSIEEKEAKLICLVEKLEDVRAKHASISCVITCLENVKTLVGFEKRLSIFKEKLMSTQSEWYDLEAQVCDLKLLIAGEKGRVGDLLVWNSTMKSEEFVNFSSFPVMSTYAKRVAEGELKEGEKPNYCDGDTTDDDECEKKYVEGAS